MPMWTWLAEAARLRPDSVADSEWPPTPLSVERDADRAADLHGKESANVRALDDALLRTFGPVIEQKARAANPLYDARRAVDTEIVNELGRKMMGWAATSP
ncbi:hypothetical protein pqer_cds_696 [Pandoravirus quercus]|uniref:DUF5848 domain-containing protein n=1 Tax=Pandoravirus quercus TaxID=2107709 RepID=A0A2U7U9I8_9VIRU|nr:hypothetical protein pqer_cds_696 [Pandoravirus quercus]AVK75118.1 hypothetical protein pqer_cds_696 [Pandoravirus quercus]